jgi:hypothetical protein
MKPFAMVSTVLFLALASASPSWAMRCQGRVVSVGDTRFEVLSKCGEPTFIEEREEEQLRRTYDGTFL